MKTMSYILANENTIEVGNRYYFGQLWNGNGDGIELIESQSIAIWNDYVKDYNIIEFKVMEKSKNVLNNIVKVMGIF